MASVGRSPEPRDSKAVVLLDPESVLVPFAELRLRRNDSGLGQFPQCRDGQLRTITTASASWDEVLTRRSHHVGPVGEWSAPPASEPGRP